MAQAQAVRDRLGAATSTSDAVNNAPINARSALTGTDDPTVPVAHVNAFADEMTKAGADWQIVTYSGTKHGFTYPDAASRKIDWIEYKKSTDERSWSAMRSFFAEIFGTTEGERAA